MNVSDQEKAFSSVGSLRLRSTAASRALMLIFEREDDLMFTHAEIGALLRAKEVQFNRVTLYRLLDRFVSSGLLRRVVNQDRVARYGREHSACRGAKIHPHFECRECHRLYQLGELPHELHEALRQVFVRWEALGHRGTEADVAVYGVCARCVPH